VTIVFSEEVFFQNSFGQFLYLHHSVARALELKSNVIRVSNGDKSGYILPNGNFYKFGKIQEYNVPIY
jgi:apolipoprotein N-acyltransferase